MRALHGLHGQARILGRRLGAQRAGGQGVEALERGFAHDEIARQVLAESGQGAQHVVLTPLAWVAAQLQFGMAVRKRAADEALGPHVVQEPGQAVVLLAEAIGLVHPEAAAVQRDHAAEGRCVAFGIHAHDGHLGAYARHLARQHIALRARRTHLAHLARPDQRRQRARHGGLAHAQHLLQLARRQRTALAAQCRQYLGGEVFQGHGNQLMNE